DATEGGALCLEVEQQVRGTRVAVTRLADRSGIEKRAHPLELELRAGGSHAPRELVRLHDLQRDVAVPDEDERRTRELEGRHRRLVVEDVLPDRVSGRAVEEGDAVDEPFGLEPAQDLEGGRFKHVSRPPGRDRGIAAELVEIERAAHGEVVVATEAEVGP